MALARALRPLAGHSPRIIVSRNAGRRFLNTDTAPVLYSAPANVTGARAEGHVTSPGLNVDLGMPEALGGKGGRTNPEELFAAGYSACFQSAMNAIAPSMGIKMPTNKSDSIIDTTVHLVGDMKQLDLGLRVDMKVKVKGVSKPDLEQLVEKTKQICPYSRATQGNVTTTVQVEAV